MNTAIDKNKIYIWSMLLLCFDTALWPRNPTIALAIKDAAEHLGKLFGRDLNRKDAVAYTNLYAMEETDWKKELGDAKTLDELRKIWNKMPKELQSDKEMIELKNAMKISLE